MERVHFLNVKQGDCIWIEHSSGRHTVIDICNGNADNEEELIEDRKNIYDRDDTVIESSDTSGNYNQKAHPTNPIEYFLRNGMKNIFRFILTHPDMDHMDGIERLFRKFDVVNFWDTDNNKTNASFNVGYKKEDWYFYQLIRQGGEDINVLQLLAAAKGEYYTNDRIEILSPTAELIEIAKRKDNYNTSSYVLLFTALNGKKVVLAGDSDEIAWDSIMTQYSDKLTNIDLLIAPHHGRKTGGCLKYLNVLNPKLTLFGNAESENLAYASWNNRELKYITNNQAANIVVEFSDSSCDVYVSNYKFALDHVWKYNSNRYFYDLKHKNLDELFWIDKIY